MNTIPVITQRIFALLVLLSVAQFSFAQHISVAADMQNVFYLGFDNPVTITAENCPCSKLVVKTTNGTINGTSCSFNYRGNEIGKAEITVYKKEGNKLKRIGKSEFRVKRIPQPIVKIGPYGGTFTKARRIVLASQQFVRAEFNYICATAQIDSFQVNIFSRDSLKVKTYFNRGGKISDEVQKALYALAKEDIVMISKVFAKGPDGLDWELDPMVLTIVE